MRWQPRKRNPMLLVDKGTIIGTCNTTMWCLDNKIPYGLDGKKIGDAWLRSMTWYARVIVRGRESDAIRKVKSAMERVPQYEALKP